MRTALVLGVARLKMAAMIAGEEYDGVTVEPLLLERGENSSGRGIDVSNATVVIAKLARPTPGQRTQILRNKRIAELIGEFPGRNVVVRIILMMRVEIGDYQQERRLGAAQKFHAALRQEIVAIDAGERYWLAGRVEDVAFIRMRRELENV